MHVLPDIERNLCDGKRGKTLRGVYVRLHKHQLTTPYGRGKKLPEPKPPGWCIQLILLMLHPSSRLMLSLVGKTMVFMLITLEFSRCNSRAFSTQTSSRFSFLSSVPPLGSTRQFIPRLKIYDAICDKSKAVLSSHWKIFCPRFRSQLPIGREQN
jgi:hypothetical protein